MFAPRDSRLRLQKPGARHGPGDVDGDVDGDGPAVEVLLVGVCLGVVGASSDAVIMNISSSGADKRFTAQAAALKRGNGAQPETINGRAVRETGNPRFQTASQVPPMGEA